MCLNTGPPDPEQINDSYLMAGLSQAAIEAYEQHYLGCAECFERLLNTLTSCCRGE